MSKLKSVLYSLYVKIAKEKAVASFLCQLVPGGENSILHKDSGPVMLQIEGFTTCASHTKAFLDNDKKKLIKAILRYYIY